MSRPREKSIVITVDVDGLSVPARLRPPEDGRAAYHVRWKVNGRWRSRTTGEECRYEAERRARDIVRGKPVKAISCGMTINEFESVQQQHHGLNDRPEAGASSLHEFFGVWKGFLAACPIRLIQEVDVATALRYLGHLKARSKTENRGWKTKSQKKLSVATIQKHVRTLASAWNLVRDGHSEQWAGIPSEQLVQSNPWEVIRKNVPKLTQKPEPIQFELEDGDLDNFLDQLEDRPVAALFVIVSLWCGFRLTAITRMEWSWIRGNYVVFPGQHSKGGRGKIVRLPPVVIGWLQAIRVAHSPHVFWSFADEFKTRAVRPSRVLSFTPGRMKSQIAEVIQTAAIGIGRPEITHHCLRRTHMELSDYSEMRAREKSSADKIQTTVGNKKSYVRRLGKKATAFADGLYENLAAALQEFPALAARLGAEPVEATVEAEMESLMKKLSPIQRKRFIKKLDASEATDSQGEVA